MDSALFRCRRLDSRLGRVGDLSEVNPALVELLLEGGITPVVAPLGLGFDGEVYNLNADTVAGALAAALGAQKLVFLTDVEGVYRNPNDASSLISKMTLAELVMMVDRFKGGMLPKLRAVVEAMKRRGLPGPCPGRAGPTRPVVGDVHSRGNRDHGHSPGRRAKVSSWIENADRTLIPAYGRTPVVFTRGEGVWLYDREGRSYLDCLTGLAVVAVGHANPRVAEAARVQLSELVHVSNIFYTEPMVTLAGRLTALSGLDRAFFANCGATANENGHQAGPPVRPGKARRASLRGSFSAGLFPRAHPWPPWRRPANPANSRRSSPLPPGFHQVPPGDIDALGEAVTDRTAAVMVETTQGEGGVVPLSAHYLQEVREMCNRRGILMIIDDVQAGIGRTGHMFSWQGLGFEPDIATVAKALANGLAIGVCLAREGGRHGLSSRRSRHHFRRRSGSLARPALWRCWTRSPSGICWPTAWRVRASSLKDWKLWMV